MFRGKNEGEPARAGATHTAGLQVGMWPTSGNSWRKRFDSTLTCGVGINARGGGVSVCWVS